MSAVGTRGGADAADPAAVARAVAPAPEPGAAPAVAGAAGAAGAAAAAAAAGAAGPAPAVARPRHALARLVAVVTPLGRVVALGAVLAGAAGYALGWRELVAVGWTAGALWLIALLHLVGSSGVEVSLRLPRDRVVAGERAPATVAVRNPLRRRAVGLTVEVPVGSGLAEVHVPSLAHGHTHEDVFVVPTSRRGVIALGPARIVRGDPIGLVRRESAEAAATRLLVHPRTLAMPSTSTGFVRDLEGRATRDLTDSDVSFQSLREYVPGDPVRHIHWRSTAKTGVHMVRRFEEIRRSHIMVALSLHAGDYGDGEAAVAEAGAPAGGAGAIPAGGTTVAAGHAAGALAGSTADAEFELAVSVVGSLGARAIVDARTLQVVASADRTARRVRRLPTVPTLPGLARTVARSGPPGSRSARLRRLATVTRDRLLDDLAEITASDRAASLVELARAASDEVAGVSVVFLVCGTGAAPAAIRSAAVGFPPGVQVVAVVCDPEVEPGLRRLGDLSVLTIGYLDDLRGALQRSAS
ncbi:DUF58 domain-containing protein [Clavibacter sepedonicus]|uniref:Membrane protein n=1 Tax=Clavibacter sepedonicus TaxID=31964 RepID=B0RFS2_CLASE|nr:DUF58 domain-containing protein [Clavibacter sepedonicus]OQJ47898.1 DUF58 domain-containing protein [Clavibacter sepedonicus]OQJ53453.1 DUF58 domain-containing protein [Clavibacter sepedonicus]UUK64638.1 DUF58 domain-containing protein [Clavibacter sepedonicus]CAQ02292.1 putative membrane protein [Clavibacter sepedonicus]